VSAHQDSYAVVTMCRVLEVSRSGYYAWRGRGPSERATEDAELTEQIREYHEESRQTYSAPRIHADLIAAGKCVGRKRVARLMKAAGIRGICRRKACRTTRRGRPSVAPDLVERDFTADGPDRLWVADITYIPTWAGFLYLAVVVDAWSRKVVGWSMRRTLATDLVLGALDMAIATRRPIGVVHHSDHGSQYTSIAFGQRCSALGIHISMGSVGDCFDNALVESFFASLECELIDRTTFETHSQARLAVFDYIEAFYNPVRRHSSLGYLSPMCYEEATLEAAA